MNLVEDTYSRVKNGHLVGDYAWARQCIVTKGYIPTDWHVYDQFPEETEQEKRERLREYNRKRRAEAKEAEYKFSEDWFKYEKFDTMSAIEYLEHLRNQDAT